jgi:glycosyltransferase involved in cell wall biosynthesis
VRILHIAPFNFSGVPIEFVRAERSLGHHSRLVTLGRDPRNYEEDICLELPFLRSPVLTAAKRLASRRVRQANLRRPTDDIPPVWKPRALESLLIHFRDGLWRRRIDELSRELDLFDFDLYQLDGGHGFLRSGRIVEQAKKNGTRIVCCYLGSDLRLRGVIPRIDSVSDLNLTLEFDHLRLHPRIHHIFYPFNPQKYKVRQKENEVLKIAHAPTSRAAKGTDTIVSTVRELERAFPVELVLIENLPHPEALGLKSTCDIMIDQLGELGYGINSLEALAMGIPTCTSLPPDLESYLQSHPFINVNEGNLGEKLIDLIEDAELRLEKAKSGRRWVEERHDSRRVVSEIHSLLSELS